MNNVLQLGIKLKSRIILCEKLETPEEKLNVFPIRDMTDNVSWVIFFIVLKIFVLDQKESLKNNKFFNTSN